jgi:hypothetical protein
LNVPSAEARVTNQETGTEPTSAEPPTTAPEAVPQPEVAEAGAAIADAVDPLHTDPADTEPVPAEPAPAEPAPADAAAPSVAEDPTPPDVPPTEVPPAQLTSPSDDATAEAPAADGTTDEASSEIPTPAEAAEVLRARFETAVADLGTLADKLAADSIPLKAAATELERVKALAASTGALAAEAFRPQVEPIEALLAEKTAAARAARAEATAAARAIKDRIVAEAEELANSEQWRVGGQRLAELLEEWKACARLDRKSDDALWKRFSHARSTFTKRRKAHYASLTAERDSVKSAKLALVEQAEALADSTQWAATAAKFRDLMTEWKNAGRAGREIDDELWERFRAAQDAFFTARKAAAPAPPRRESGPRGPRPERDRRPASSPAPQQPRTNPAAVARAKETVETLRNLIESFEAKAAKAVAAGDEKAAASHKEAAEARRAWLAEAERTLAELS